MNVSLRGSDGSTSIDAVLELNKDPTKHPRLAKITKSSTSDVSDVLSEIPETHVIVSTGSGHQAAAVFYDECISPLLAAVYPQDHQTFHVHTTTSATSVLELAITVFFPKANAGTPLRILLLSGDGGIIDLINGLTTHPSSPSYTAPQTLLLPLGTANALFHSLNAGNPPTWGIPALTSHRSKPLPLFSVAFSPGARLLVDEARSEEELATDPASGHPSLHGAVVCSWGLHASLVADSDTAAYRKFGVERFKMAANEALYPASGSPHVYKAKVSVLRGDAWTALPEQEHLYTLATMVSHLEQPFCISPRSRPLDGSLHLVHFGPTSGDEAMRLMTLAYQGGKHVEEAAVRYEAIDGLRIEFEGGEEEGRWRRICVDGKIVRVEKGGWVELRKETRRVLDVVVA
ncbi:ATP-NAD kinase-like domain-containing protein [Boeremia exigua]|uniref:ATP-NAD kinase-like domain-containing protein n=1 Tax=Boeremia exigua TaxID=749465 RepID=UPI001E8E2AA0|nr:ATP-NAD kinase-like domain-containing protein [Boeremia exigua]KAH6616263.1 ATP-NAD kinase-like domain-containing protein [Boeremia exigua]